MEASVSHLAGQLKEKGIRPSIQRIKILEYLNLTGGHPTVEEIYSALAPVIPSLSKVTIYNTLHTFLGAGLVRLIEIDDSQMRYDITLEDHGHFLCAQCGTIYNFPFRFDPLAVAGLTRFQVTHKNVYLKGLCPNCWQNQTEPRSKANE